MPDIPDNISRDHLLKAIEEISRTGIPQGANSSTYDVHYEGKRFPPKLVVSIANRFANGQELDRQSFNGGLNTPAFKLLEDAGLQIVEKNSDGFKYDEGSNSVMNLSEPLNQILYGPPGTGKTFHTVNKALKILDPDFYSANASNRKALKSRFDELKREGRVETVTFHQSFSYEDFVEGLRAAVNDNGQIFYQIESGIFKKICESAGAKETISSKDEINISGRRIWKMSLGNTLGDDGYVFDDCIQECRVLLGYGNGLDFTNVNTRKDVEHVFKSSGIEIASESYDISAVNIFKNEMQVGDLVVVSDGNLKFRAIAEVTSDYEFLKDRQNDEYRQSRKVNWLRVYSPSLPRERLMDKSFSQKTLYELKVNSINLTKLSALLGHRRNRSLVFHEGQVIGTDYVVRESNSDVLRLTKPNGSLLGLDMQLISELVELVSSGKVSIQDITDKRVFEKTESRLEKHIVNGYNSLLAKIVGLIVEETPNTNDFLEKGESWVLIIDEINRGNFANIFGELITLIEDSKRAGSEEGLEVTLPYSKELFSVPNNLYIIGTMNTADRSLVSIDSALRRRFSFEEMMPSPEVLVKSGIDVVEGINIVKMLEVMNQRIELLFDREHTLGHSFFIPLVKSPTLTTLAEIFDRQILPLLEEYFFEDWSRIRQILGDDQKEELNTRFIVPKYHEANVSGIFSSDVVDELSTNLYERNREAFMNPDSYRLIYDSNGAA